MPHTLARSFAACCVSLLLLPALASADYSETFTGNTAGAPTFNRPDAVCGATTTNVVYRAQTFFLQSPATCYVYGQQEYDGFLHLYFPAFDPANPTANCIAGDDDGDLGAGTSQLEALELAQGPYTLVTSAAAGGQRGAFNNTLHCDQRQPQLGTCAFVSTPREQQVCLLDRFAVRVVDVSNHPSDGVATPVRSGSVDSGLFWFYSDTNWELTVKVLDGCAINGHYWVFAASPTNQAYTIQVGDRETQQTNSYSNALGTAAPAITDTLAFDCP